MTQTTIVLGCSRTKRSHLAAVVETLAGRGNAVEVVSGLDDNDEPWRDAIHRLGSEGVYVLCSDEHVNLRRVGQLRGLLSEASIPASRAWCGPIDWSKPVEVIRHIEHLLQPKALSAPSTVAKPVGPSEVSGTVVAPPSLSTAPLGDPDPSASHTFTSMRLAKSVRWKPLAAIGGVALLGLAAAVVVPRSDNASESDSSEVEVSAVAAVPAEPASPESSEAPTEVPEASGDAAATAASSLEEEIEIASEDAASLQREAIISALAEQKIRALDVLLLAPEAKQITRRGNEITARFDFEKAFTYCTELDIDGLGEWRLPTAGELASLSANKMLAKGVYWSETEGDSFGNERVVWSVRKKRMKPMRRSYTGARTLCVRNVTDR